MTTEVEIFKSLSDESRLRIINLFIKFKERLCVCELVDALGMPQYAISKSLTLLKNSGLLLVEKKGTWMYYALNGSAKNKKLFKFLSNSLDNDIFINDEQQLNKRLLLRKDNICVIGLVPKNN